MNATTPIFKYVLLLSLFCGGGILFFWDDIKEFSADRLLAKVWDDASAGPSLSDNEISGIREVHFEKARNNAGFISVDHVSLVDQSTATTTISIRIRNRWRFNDFPSLRLTVHAASGNVIDTFTRSSSEYEHGALLRDEVVTLTLPTVANQSRYTVVAFYPEDTLR